MLGWLSVVKATSEQTNELTNHASSMKVPVLSQCDAQYLLLAQIVSMKYQKKGLFGTLVWPMVAVRYSAKYTQRSRQALLPCMFAAAQPSPANSWAHSLSSNFAWLEDLAVKVWAPVKGSDGRPIAEARRMDPSQYTTHIDGRAAEFTHRPTNHRGYGVCFLGSSKCFLRRQTGSNLWGQQ